MTPSRSKPAALISYSYWKRALGGADSVVGKQILLDDRSYTIVGVLPANLRLMLTGPSAQRQCANRTFCRQV